MSGLIKSPIKGPSGLGEETRGPESKQTTDATQTDVISIPVNPGEAVHVRTVIVAQSAGNEYGSWYLDALFYRIGTGNVTREGLDQSLSTHLSATSAATAAIEADTTNQAAVVRVTGEAGKTLDWKVTTSSNKVVRT